MYGSRNEQTGFRVILLTAYPPVYGGISILSRRLFEGLRSRGIEAQVVSENRPHENKCVKWVGRYRHWFLSNLIRRPGKNTIVHYFMDSWNVRAVLGLLALLRTFRCVLSVNNARSPNTLTSHSLIARRVLLELARRGTSQWIAVSDLVRQQLLDLGISNERLSIIASFIPPQEHEVEASLPQEILDFIQSHDPICSSVAFRLDFHNGADLYGADLCIQAMRKLILQYPKIGFIFCVPLPGNIDYLNQLKATIQETGVQSAFLLYDRPLDQVCPVWKNSTVFVRATNTDGDPLSVREALFLGTPVVASDVSPRPAPCVLFKNRDIDSLTTALSEVLGDVEFYKRAACQFGDPTNALEQIVQIYTRVARQC